MRHFISPLDLSRGERLSILERAGYWKQVQDAPTPRNTRVGALFFNNSLRTRVSFEQAAWRLGAHCLTLNSGSDTWQIELDSDAIMDQTSVENIVEAAGVMGRYFDILGIRAFAGSQAWSYERTEPILSAFMKYAGIPILSLEGGVHHPCQGLADELTLRETFGDPTGEPVTLMWAWHPNPLPTAVPNTFALQAALAGCNLTIAHPEGYDLDEEIMGQVRAAAESNGGSVRVTHDGQDGLANARAVYVKSWGSLKFWDDKDADRAYRANLRDWRLDADNWRATDTAKVMHCLPVRRNLKISGDLLDSEHSLIYEQAENRLWAQTALLEHMLEVNRK